MGHAICQGPRLLADDVGRGSEAPQGDVRGQDKTTDQVLNGRCKVLPRRVRTSLSGTRRVLSAMRFRAMAISQGRW
jgi:hypothetical protein